MTRFRWTVAPVLILAAAGCRSESVSAREARAEPPHAERPPAATNPAEPPPAEPASGWIEVFPGVRVDRAAGAVEFDGIVPIDAHDPHTPIVYLELIACIPDTREHESLVMTNAKPSHIHAALLMAGLLPGAPGRKDAAEAGVVVTPPTGDVVDVVLVHRNSAGERIESSPVDWIIHERDSSRLAEPTERGLWTFSGSVMDRRGSGEAYRADFTGDLIGLATFADETIAWGDVFSPQASIDEPVWIADARSVPAYRTPVTVRLSRIPVSDPGR